MTMNNGKKIWNEIAAVDLLARSRHLTTDTQENYGNNNSR
jgi:hypothetical protein